MICFLLHVSMQIAGYFERTIHFLAIGRYLQKNPKWFIAWHQFFFDAIFHPNHFWVKKNYTVLHTKISRSMGHLNPPWPNRFSLLCKATFFQHTNMPFLIIWSVDNRLVHVVWDFCPWDVMTKVCYFLWWFKFISWGL